MSLNTNSRIKELKLISYKKKIKEKLSPFLGLNMKVFSSNEINIKNKNFVINSFEYKNAQREYISIYDTMIHSYYKNIHEIEEKARNLFKNNLDIFFLEEDVYFNYDFNDESFLVKCIFFNLKNHIDILLQKKFPIILYNENLTSLLTLYELEYEIEFMKWHN